MPHYFWANLLKVSLTLMEKPLGIWHSVSCLRKAALAAGAGDQTPDLRISGQPALPSIADATDFPRYFPVHLL